MSLINEGRIGENVQIETEVLTISSATVTSRWYDMSDCRSICFTVGIGTAVAGLQSALQVIQSANRQNSTVASVATATAVVGSTANTRIDRAIQLLLTMATDSTIGNTFNMNGATFTFATARAATAGQYGSTVDATAAGGLEQMSSSLAAAINSLLSSICSASTASTLAVRVNLRDDADTYLCCTSTNASAIAMTHEIAQAMIELKADKLGSTSRYVALQLGTVATAVRAAVTVVKDGLRFNMAHRVHGAYTKA